MNRSADLGETSQQIKTTINEKNTINGIEPGGSSDLNSPNKNPKRIRQRKEGKPQDLPNNNKKEAKQQNNSSNGGVRSLGASKELDIEKNKNHKQPNSKSIDKDAGIINSNANIHSPTTKSVIVSVLNTQNFQNNNSTGVNVNMSDKLVEKTENQIDNLTSGVAKDLPKQTSIELNSQFEIELERNYIFKIKKNVKPNDSVRYMCNICNYFCDTIEICKKHINGPIHKNNMDTIKLEMKIRDLEMPSKSRLDCLGTYLVDFYSKNIISIERLQHAYEIFKTFRAKFYAKHSNLQFQINMYGSMAHGICFNDSQCEISVELVNEAISNSSSGKSPATIIRDINDLIRNEISDQLVSVEEDTEFLRNEAKYANLERQNSNKVTFKSKHSTHNVIFNFTTGIYPSAYKTSTLLRAYMDLDERAKILALCFRYMAKISQIDRVDFCTLSPHSFIIMVIYFLQKINPPVLPVLQEIVDFKTLKTNSSIRPINNNKHSKKSKKRTGNSNNENIFTDELNDLDEDELLQLEKEDERFSKQDFNIFKTNLKNFVNSNSWKSENNDSLGALWLKLLTFYSLDFGFKKNFISIRKQTRISKSSIKMYSKKMSIEDPFYFKQSLSKNLITQTNKYITNVVSKTCINFVLTTHSINLIDNEEQTAIFSNGKSVLCELLPNLNASNRIVEKLILETGITDARKSNQEVENLSENDDNSSSDEDSNSCSSSCSDTFENAQNEISDSENSSGTDRNSNEFICDVKSDGTFGVIRESSKLNADLLTESLDTKLNILDKKSIVKNKNHKNENFCLAQVQQCLDNILDKVNESENHEIKECEDEVPNLIITKMDLKNHINLNLNTYYKFTPNALGIPKNPPKICSHCNKEGHLQFECPQDQLPNLEELPEMSDQWRQVLDDVFQCIYEDNRQTKEEEKIRSELLDEIKRIVWQKYPSAKLSLFGSSNNGFAMKKSDLDICMTVDDCSSNGDDVNFKRIIRNLGLLFRREYMDFDQIEERVSAKVPIVKFRHKKTMIEGDISLYNTLALKNTDLLRSYATIDERTKTLGYVVKHFAKICRIGDASCGSLSSYAYIVMMIHYLMNTEPPILPCLQQLNRDKYPKNSTNHIIDGWDCWFNQLDLDELAKHWPHLNQNKQTVGQLWVGFLRYYTEKFDWEQHVVCIRKSDAPLSRKDKNWNKHRLAIEDPFELSHNLAAGVSHKMGLYILKCFARARSLFGKVIDDFRPEEIRLNVSYFFNPLSLVEGNPPMDRNCYSCFKIGHQTRNCPLTNAKRRDKLNQQQPNSQSDLSSQNDSNIVCYRCKVAGHRAKECPGDLRRQKTVSVSINSCQYSTNQVDYQQYQMYNRQFIFNNNIANVNRDFSAAYQNANYNINGSPKQKQHHQQQKPPQKQQTPQQTQHFFQFQNQNFPLLSSTSFNATNIPQQQSAPAPKMISVVKPLVLHSGENVQMVVSGNQNSSGTASTAPTLEYLNYSLPTTSSSSSPSSSSSSSGGGGNSGNNHVSFNTKQQYSVPEQQQHQPYILQRQQSYPLQYQTKNTNNSNFQRYSTIAPAPNTGMIDPIAQQNYYNIFNNAHNQFNPNPTIYNYNYYHPQLYEQNLIVYNDFNDIQQQQQHQSPLNQHQNGQINSPNSCSKIQYPHNNQFHFHQTVDNIANSDPDSNATTNSTTETTN